MPFKNLCRNECLQLPWTGRIIQLSLVTQDSADCTTHSDVISFGPMSHPMCTAQSETAKTAPN